MPARRPIDHPRLMAAALAIVDADGYDALSLSSVAASLGVGPSALYTHVDGLDGLRRATAVESTRRLTVTVRDAAIGRAGDDALWAAAVAYRGYARRHPGRFTATLRIVDGGDDIEDARNELDAVFELLSRARGLDEPVAGRTARNTRRAIHGFVVVEHSSPDAPEDDESADDDFEALVEVLCRAVAR